MGDSKDYKFQNPKSKFQAKPGFQEPGKSFMRISKIRRFRK
jgi:hypothetical protein